MQTDFAVGLGKFDTPAIPAVGHPAFGDFAGGTSFFVPAAGVIRALDLGVNEYQGGQDFVAAYDPSTGQFRPGFPSPVNDLSVPERALGRRTSTGCRARRSLGGTASLDLYGMNAAGAPFDPPGWPKLTGDWTVANPAIGSFGTQDTDSSARKVVIALTRAGTLLAYNTDAPVLLARARGRASTTTTRARATCAATRSRPASRRRDGLGRNVTLQRARRRPALRHRRPLRDRQSDNPITGANFDTAEPLAGAPAPARARQRASPSPFRPTPSASSRSARSTSRATSAGSP